MLNRQYYRLHCIVERQPLSARDLSTDGMYRYVIFFIPRLSLHTQTQILQVYRLSAVFLRVASDKTTAALFSVRVPIGRNEPSSDGDLACRLQSRSHAHRTSDTVFDSAIGLVSQLLLLVPPPPPYPIHDGVWQTRH